ncbi:hypothetical protein [Mesorhizobium carmichaelinearum]|uniref:hypothetical protein n=1 Tax=Mesorhizobium carmichaelinearum TaxID=1208188 RepID=UPI000BA42DAE|nr:hypothetical protein [Mesorhizobium carmichaelinearum]
MIQIGRTLSTGFGAAIASIWVSMAVPAMADECNIPKATIHKGGTVIAKGISSLRSAPPEGAFGTLGDVIGSTEKNKEYVIDDEKCVRIVFFGRQLWLLLKGAGWALSGTDDVPYQYFSTKN